MRRPPKLCRNGDRAYVTIPGSKIRKYLGPWGAPETEAAYESWLARHLVSKKIGIQAEDGGGGMLVDMAKAYLAYAEEYYGGRDTTTFRNVKTAIFYLLEIARDLPTSEIRGGLIGQYQKHLLNKTNRARHRSGPLSRQYINSLTKKVRLFIKWGVTHDYAPPEAYYRVSAVEDLASGRTTAPDAKAVEPVPLEVVMATLPHLSKRVRDLLLVQLLCGMRPSEARLMQWQEIDRSADVWLYQPKRHKNSYRGKSLVKAIPAQAREVLERYQPAEEGYVFRSPWTGGPYSGGSIGSMIRAVCAGHGIPHWSPNQLRHTIATHVKREHGWAAAKAYLGHAAVSTTEIYAAEEAQDVARVAKLLGDDETINQSLASLHQCTGAADSAPSLASSPRPCGLRSLDEPASGSPPTPAPEPDS